MRPAARSPLLLAAAVSAVVHGALVWTFYGGSLRPQSARLYELQLSPGFAVTPGAGASARERMPDPDPAAPPAAPHGESGASGALTRSISDLTLSIPYPQLARSMNLEGRALIHCQLAPDGRVLDAHVAESSGHRVLDQAALRAVRAWRFPAAAPQNLAIPIEFRLRPRGAAL